MHFVKTMAPGWFASVMGTSVASLAAQLLFAGTAAVWIADALHYTAIAMLLVLGIAAVLRILVYPRAVFDTISHPVEGSFYATFPIALLVMAGQWSMRGIDPNWVALLWWTGAIGTFAASYLILFRLFTLDRLKLQMVTPAHFIPAVGLVVIPVAGAGLAAQAQGLMREVYFGVNMLGMGAGFFMYIALVAITMARHFLMPARRQDDSDAVGASGSARCDSAESFVAFARRRQRSRDELRLVGRDGLYGSLALVASFGFGHDRSQRSARQTALCAFLVGIRLSDRSDDCVEHSTFEPC